MVSVRVRRGVVLCCVVSLAWHSREAVFYGSLKRADAPRKDKDVEYRTFYKDL